MSQKNRCTDSPTGQRLSAYEMGLLSPGEEAQFEDHLRDCPTCQEQLYELAPAIAEIRREPGRYAPILARQRRAREASPLLERLVGWFRERADSVSLKSLVPAVATLAILVAVYVQQRSEPDWGRLARVEAIAYVQMPTRGMGAVPEARFREGMASYVQKDYATSARRLGLLVRELDLDTPALLHDQAAFFAGLSLLIDGRPDSAAVYLEIASESMLPVVRDRARWFLSQAALLRGEPEDARAILEELKRVSPGYGVQAAEQLEAIEQIRGD